MSSRVTLLGSKCYKGGGFVGGHWDIRSMADAPYVYLRLNSAELSGKLPDSTIYIEILPQCNAML